MTAEAAALPGAPAFAGPVLGTLRLPAAEAERAAVLALRNPRPVPGGRTVYAAVTRFAREEPGRTAVLDGERAVGYAGLLERATTLAALLDGRGIRRGDVVAVVGARGADVLAAFLATESIGAVYLPVEPGWPARRVADVLRRGDAACLLRCPGADVSAASAGAEEAGVPALSSVPAASGRTDPGTDTRTDARTETATDTPTDPSRAAAAVAPDDPAYVIFTSGTTGAPKGAVVERRGMLNHLWAKIDDLGLGPDDVLAFTAPLAFDISLWQMLAPLLVGAAVAVVADPDLAYPRRLSGALGRSGATVVELVPTMAGWLAAQAEREGAGTLPRLRALVSTGEELKPTVAARIMSALPGVGLFNAYGPTECSDDVTHHTVTEADLTRPRLPVGVPVANAVLYVLVADAVDGSWRAAGPGEAGDLFVGGLPVGRGYVNDAVTTASAFFTDCLDPHSPTGRLYRTGDLARVEDGAVHYLGRGDRQVKVAGVRMELDEIEIALGRHPGLDQCAVTVTDGELAAHYVPSPGTDEPSRAELKCFLSATLPPALVPGRWSRLDRLPLTANGKVDHRSLQDTSHRKGQR
ncbi:amino acid adenylation domain-containing protein [Streptomyces sp. NPDC051546]|uniref:amino acid adenylation domain-containing protein n=1 Tax=Streptomyces sp. NPDC051546 TaxID=3365655 RepID=UPI0037891C84